MKLIFIRVIPFILLFTACVSIPKETVTLSQTLGTDLQTLQNAHLNLINLHFRKIKDNINSFVNDVYSPYVIHYALKRELKNYKDGKPSIYGTIEIAGKKEGKTESENAMNEIADFLDAARQDIESERDELLTPIQKQESEVIAAVNQSYENVLYANSTITAYLQSVQKLRSAQHEALSRVGLAGADTLFTNSILRVSDLVDKAVKEGKKIDIQSNDAYSQLEKITNQIKEITIKK